MAEYIERDKVVEAVLELPPKMDEQGYGWLGRRGVWQMLCDFPAADVQPVKHGDWVIPHTDSEQVYCSLCNWHVYGDLFTPYCPGCGAKMDM